MQVILLKDVKALKKKGQIVSMSDGYARNLILSRKLGVGANSKDLSDLRLKKANNDRVVAERLAVAEELGTKLDESSVTLTIKVEEGGRTLESVSSKGISKATGDQPGIDIDKKGTMLNDPIKSTGSFEVSVKLHKEVTARLAAGVVGA